MIDWDYKKRSCKQKQLIDRKIKTHPKHQTADPKYLFFQTKVFMLTEQIKISIDEKPL